MIHWMSICTFLPKIIFERHDEYMYLTINDIKVTRYARFYKNKLTIININKYCTIVKVK